MGNSSKKISKIVLIAVIASCVSFCLYAVPLVYAVDLPNDPSVDILTYVALAQQNIIIDGTLQTKPIAGFPPNFQIALDYGTMDRATAITTYTNASFPSVAVNSQGFVNTGQVAAGNGLRTTDTLPQNRMIVSGTAYDGTNFIAGPSGTILQDVTVTCRGGSVVETQPAIIINGKVEIGMPAGENDCKLAYNFVGYGSASSAGSTAFSGNLTVTPGAKTVIRGNATADYTVTYQSVSDYNGSINLVLTGACPVSSCTFSSGSSGSVGPNGSFSKTFRMTTVAGNAAGSYPFTVQAAPTTSLSDASRITANAKLEIYEIPSAINPTNHAQFVGYANVPATMNPGETKQVRVVMKNDGTKPWVPNTAGAGATCSSNPKNNGYALHSVNDDPTWGVTKVDVGNSANNAPLATTIPSARYYRIYGETTGMNVGVIDVTKAEFFDTNGNNLPIGFSGGYEDSRYPYPTSLTTTATPYPGGGTGYSWYKVDFHTVKTLSEIRVTPSFYAQPGLRQDKMYFQYSNDGVNFTSFLTIDPLDPGRSEGVLRIRYSTKQVDGTGMPTFKYLKLRDINDTPFPQRTWGGLNDVKLYDATGALIPAGLLSAYAPGPYADSGHDPSYAIDSDSNTDWRWGNDYPVYGGTTADFVITLASPMSISRISADTATFNGGNGPGANRRMELYVSNDGATWKNFYYLPNNNFPLGGVTFTNPGLEEFSFTFNITAPAIGGTYPFQWRMSEECIGGFDNSSVLQNITVNGGVAPIVNLSVHTPSLAGDPTGSRTGSVFKNGNYELKWTTGNSPDSCTASGSWSGGKAAGGSSEDRSSDAATTGVKTYTITCVKNGVSVADTVKVQVNAPPSQCDTNAVGTNKLVGCVWSWDTAAANAAGVAFGSAPDVASQFWSLAGQAPNGNTMTVPVADTATALDKDWTSGGPLGLNSRFLINWKGSFNFKNSGYTFTGGSSDGHAVYLDNNKITDDWSDHVYRTKNSTQQSLTAANHQIQMLHYFNGTDNAHASLTWVNTSAPIADNSQCLSVSAPSSVVAGSNFTATVRVQNTGSASWTTPQYTLSSIGYKFPPKYWTPLDASLPSTPIAPGASAAFTLNLTATTTPGSYPFSWQMIHQNVAWFGPICSSPTNITVTPVVAATYSINITKTSGGSVKSVDGLIDCGTTCANTYTQNSTVTLKAYPDSTLWQFTGWTGACSGTGDCTLVVNGSKTVSALFQRRPLIYQEF